MDAPHAGPRDLRTVLFTDIVDSTARAVDLGDAEWSGLLQRHNALIREILQRFNGREEDTAGDGFFATFARPTDALECAAAVVDEVHTLGLHVRAGIHAGEVERVDGKPGGVAVHIAARLMAIARSDQILVSGTVRDLVSGGSFQFVDRGDVPLKGIARPVHAWVLTSDTAALGPTALRNPRVGVRRSLAAPPVAGALAVVAVMVAATLAVQGGLAGPSAPPGRIGGPSTLAVGQSGPSGTSTGIPPSATPGAFVFGFGGARNGVIGLDAGGDTKLAAGRYEESDYQTPHLTMTLGPGWSLVSQRGTAVGLIRSDDRDEFLGFAWPSVVPTEPCGKTTRPLSASPADFKLWLTHTPALDPSPIVTRYFGPYAMFQTDVSVVIKLACAGADPPAFVLSASIPGENGQAAGTGGEAWPAGLRYRLTFGEVDGRLLRVLIQAPDDQAFLAFDPLVEAVLSTIAVASSPTSS